MKARPRTQPDPRKVAEAWVLEAVAGLAPAFYGPQEPGMPAAAAPYGSLTQAPPWHRDLPSSCVDACSYMHSGVGGGGGGRRHAPCVHVWNPCVKVEAR